MSILEDIKPLIEQIKSANEQDEVIFNAVSFNNLSFQKEQLLKRKNREFEPLKLIYYSS